ncbi:MAG TPA: YfbM family protein [Pirellulales bacterium]|nr:YfbM family protein [Pirellulales bacterium]
MGMYCSVSAASSGDLARLSSGPDSSGGISGRGTATADRVSLEKAWHGLHYLLTGETWEGHGPLAFLLAGGERLSDDQESPLRWFAPEETNQIYQALSNVSDDQLWSRFDANEMEQQQIYPGIWDEPEDDLKEEYLTYFRELKQVVAMAAKAGQGLLVTLG